ncbi:MULTISPECIES: major tail shaft subunit [Citrobacter]|uniref:major tail shaft subunit n=1 Tax=Citrobacter TaxID=544 RepID=UPI000456426F|nr:MULTISPECIES: major tail shaft subunit [Citrobacter]AHY13745.1 major tail shaft subunit [Citrobacter freundii CFNIH1]EKW1652673.1 phage tail protein [Citrobacter freundii]KAA0552256.1 phage tail protein [Citrobacter werkmanii]MBD0821811.1 phage tail protein [Citrobacter sp. C5_2]MBM7188213.1 phage tail protein [Citrobacter freundii]
MADENNTPKSSPEYAMLPAGTVVKFGEVNAAVAALKPLINCKALGATGQTGGFVDCTTLLDKSKQSISDLPEGPEKSLGFIDDPGNEDFTAFLNAAEQRKTVQFYIELPNKRTASMILALSGWQMNEITAPASEVIQITVQGKQNNIKWGIAAPAPDAGA